MTVLEGNAVSGRTAGYGPCRPGRSADRQFSFQRALLVVFTPPWLDPLKSSAPLARADVCNLIGVQEPGNSPRDLYQLLQWFSVLGTPIAGQRLRVERSERR